jgi:hypothetical protein
MEEFERTGTPRSAHSSARGRLRPPRSRLHAEPQSGGTALHRTRHGDAEQFRLAHQWSPVDKRFNEHLISSLRPARHPIASDATTRTIAARTRASTGSPRWSIPNCQKRKPGQSEPMNADSQGCRLSSNRNYFRHRKTSWGADRWQ